MANPARQRWIVAFILFFAFASANDDLYSEYPENPLWTPYGDIARVPDFDYEPESLIEDKFILKTSEPLGDVSGLAFNSKGNLVAFHRADRHWDNHTFTPENILNITLDTIKAATVAIINVKTGEVIKELGQDRFYMPHGLTIDKDDNYWITDVGSHQIHKFDKNFKHKLTLGKKLVPGSDEKHFCKPTDVAIASNGHFFVADGYCNHRVLKFDAKGKLLSIIASDMERFAVPHSLALIEDLNLLCVADRDNERVMCFSAGLKEGHRSIPAGIPITRAMDIGRVYAIREKNHYLFGVTADPEGNSAQLFAMGIETGRASTFLPELKDGHALAVAPSGTYVYVAQMNPHAIIGLNLAPEDPDY